MDIMQSGAMAGLQVGLVKADFRIPREVWIVA